MTSILWIKIHTQECSNGYFKDEFGCRVCHSSCKTCENCSQCTNCKDSYTSLPNGLWEIELCPDSKFFSVSAGQWTDCTSSCDYLWAYQSHCFVWPTGEFLDLDTMTWVGVWNSDNQISITDTQLNNIPIWRSFTYYVDSSSDSVTELGTYDHPYKDLSSVFVELFNFHSHSDRSIIIKVHEDTTNYIMQGTYILNITNVLIESYSKTSSVPYKAKIVAVYTTSFIVALELQLKIKSYNQIFWIKKSRSNPDLKYLHLINSC